MKIFWDFDGTLYEFITGIGPDKWAAPGYARTLNKLSDTLHEAITLMAEVKDLNGEPIEHYLLSAVVDMDYAVKDKKFAIKRDKLPIDEENMIFVKYGQSKADAIKAAGVEIDKGDLFIDDYTPNLNDMDEMLTCVKVLNGINDTHRSWKGSRISAFASAKSIMSDLMAISYMDTIEEAA